MSTLDGLSKYFLYSGITVSAGAELQIAPGVEIQGRDHAREFEVFGRLVADGVTFNGRETSVSSIDIDVNDGGDADLTDCTFIGYAGRVDYSAGSSGTVSNCDGDYWDIDIDSDSVSVVNGSSFRYATVRDSASIFDSSLSTSRHSRSRSSRFHTTTK